MLRSSYLWILPLATFLAGLLISGSISTSYGSRPAESALAAQASWTDQQIREYLRDIHTISQELGGIRKAIEEQAKKQR